MPTIGETLREARMRQKLDIADVERRTKIRAKYLRALENEEFAMLPGPTFVKTFLRTYSELLGLDPHALVEEYRANYEPRDEFETLTPLGAPGAPGRDRRRGIRPPPLLVAGLLVAAVLTGLVILGLNADDEPDGGEAADTTPAPRTEEARTETRERPAPPRRVVVRISPITPTYVCMDRGEGTDVFFEQTLDSPQTFRGRRLRANLGKSVIDVRVNGQRLQIEPGPEPVGFDFTPGATRPLPSGERPCA